MLLNKYRNLSFSRYQSISTRKVLNILNLRNGTVYKILKHQLHLYHIQHIYSLIHADFPSRIALCQWFLQTLVLSTTGAAFFTDEVNFSRNSLMNFHNNHVWAEQIHMKYVKMYFQHQFLLNFWIGILGDWLIGPVFLP